MHVALPESESPVKLVLDPEHPLTDDQYFAFCAANSNLRIERTARGEIVLLPTRFVAVARLGKEIRPWRGLRFER